MQKNYDKKRKKDLLLNFCTSLSNSVDYFQFSINLLAFTLQTTIASYKLSIIWNTTTFD